MARAATTLDAYNAVAEPRRREVLDALARSGGGELPVNELVEMLRWPQPQVSKHLSVLRRVGLVAVRREGRKRMYRIDGQQLKTIHDWTRMFERFWENQLERIKDRAEKAARTHSQTRKETP